MGKLGLPGMMTTRTSTKRFHLTASREGSPMHTLTISGTPEDLIKFEGELNEELGIYELQDTAFVAFSDGTLLEVNLDEGEIWKIETITLGANTVMEKVEGTVETGTDKVSLTNPVVAFQWILLGSNLIKNR
jgi:hypothetical protein